MNEIYYIAVNGRREGPFTLEELRSRHLAGETLVWKTGMPTWSKAVDFPELRDSLSSPHNYASPPEEPHEWFAMMEGNRQEGPKSIKELIDLGIDHSTPVWRNGMPDWAEARNVPEISVYLDLQNTMKQPPGMPPHGAQPGPDFSRNPQYDPNHTYNKRYDQRGGGYGYGNNYGTGSPQNNPYTQQNPYDPYRNQVPTNWLPWAIVSTVLGFFCSCIGAIFGIIGIVEANKANNFYAAGNYREGDRVNSNAKTMTIIGLVLAGIGLVVGLSTGFSIFN